MRRLGGGAICSPGTPLLGYCDAWGARAERAATITTLPIDLDLARVDWLPRGGHDASECLGVSLIGRVVHT
jgi:hypothetical protein